MIKKNFPVSCVHLSLSDSPMIWGVSKEMILEKVGVACGKN